VYKRQIIGREWDVVKRARLGPLGPSRMAVVDTESGEFSEKTLSQEGNEVREFYAALEGPVAVRTRRQMFSARDQSWSRISQLSG